MFFVDEVINKRNIKLTAYNTLLDCGVKTLPVDPLKILKSRCDINLNSFTFFEKFGWSMDDFKQAYGTYGGVNFNIKLKKYFISYNDNNPDILVNWTLACLLACIELGNVDSVSFLIITCHEGDDSDIFADYFLSPDVILKAAGITSAEDIISECHIPFNKAYKKSKKIQFSFGGFRNSIDKVLKFSFDEYIESYKNNIKHNGLT